MHQGDWAALSREYRRRLGVKQEAIAQDFDVDQSTASRWERGAREPSLDAKHMILNTLLDSRVGPTRSIIAILAGTKWVGSGHMGSESNSAWLFPPLRTRVAPSDYDR